MVAFCCIYLLASIKTCVHSAIAECEAFDRPPRCIFESRQIQCFFMAEVSVKGNQ